MTDTDHETSARTSHDIDYRICGSDFQYLDVGLDPGETVIAQRGAMLVTEDGIDYKARLADPVSGGKRWAATGAGTAAAAAAAALVFGAPLLAVIAAAGAALVLAAVTMSAAVKRRLVGESMWLAHFTNITDDTERKRVVSLSTNRPGQIVAIDLHDVGGELIAEREAFFAAAAGTEIGLSLRRKIRAGLFGGEGFVLQRITGDGWVFLHAHGTVFERRLKGGSLLVDTGCIVAMQPSVEYSANLSGGALTMAFGGEGVFLAKLSGRGRVWLQSQPRPQPPKNKSRSHTRSRQRRR